MRKQWIACSLLLALALPELAAAGDFDRSGFYLGVGGSYTAALWDEELEDEFGIPVNVDDAWGVNARAGVRIWKALAVEAQYEWLDAYAAEVNNVEAFEVESHALTANLKLYLPIWRIHPYLLAGVGFAHIELDDSLGLGLSESETSLAGRGALGLDVYLTEHIALYAEGGVLVVDEEIDTGVPGFDAVGPLLQTGAQLGLLFRF
jgi:opacity protein-like surface antigen